MGENSGEDAFTKRSANGPHYAYRFGPKMDV